jgi:hypothetical protein
MYCGNDREAEKLKTTVARQRSAHNSGTTVGSGIFCGPLQGYIM